MFRPLRTLISLTVLAGMVWFSFAVELGDKTLAEHVDTISATPEAKQLLEGTRETIDPALDDVRDRMLGEYVEAPTFIAEEARPGDAASVGPSPWKEAVIPASTSTAAAAPEPPLPGRRRPRAVASHEEEAPPEPARPGRRLRPNVLATIEADPEPEPVEIVIETVLAPAPEPAPKPVELPRVPWPRSSDDDRSFLAPALELARKRPPRPEPTPIPIVHPQFDPELPELPSAR